MDVNAPSTNAGVDIDLNSDIEGPSANLPEGNINADVSGPSGDVKLKNSNSFMDKLGGMFKFGGSAGTKKDDNKRGKKRKRNKDGDLDIEGKAGVNLDVDANVNPDTSLEASSKASTNGEDAGFIVVDTPTMKKKDIGADADVSTDGSVKGPKSPSLLRRIGMFFHIGGKTSYNIDGSGEKKKKRRKLSAGSNDKVDSDIGANISVKRDDSFTIPEAELNAPSLEGKGGATGDLSGGITGGLSAGANVDAPSAKEESESDASISFPSMKGNFFLLVY